MQEVCSNKLEPKTGGRDGCLWQEQTLEKARRRAEANEWNRVLVYGEFGIRGRVTK